MGQNYFDLKTQNRERGKLRPKYIRKCVEKETKFGRPPQFLCELFRRNWRRLQTFSMRFFQTEEFSISKHFI